MFAVIVHRIFDIGGRGGPEKVMSVLLALFGPKMAVSADIIAG